MLNTKEIIEYDIDFYLTKENGTWIVQNPDNTTLEKIHGLYEEDVIDFITNISNKYTNIRIKGLMTMAPFTENEDEVREVFRSLKNLSLDIDKLNIPNVSMKYLSMGMSNDYKIAVEEGSTIVRVGTSIFGERNYNNQ